MKIENDEHLANYLGAEISAYRPPELNDSSLAYALYQRGEWALRMFIQRDPGGRSKTLSIGAPEFGVGAEPIDYPFESEDLDALIARVEAQARVNGRTPPPILNEPADLYRYLKLPEDCPAEQLQAEFERRNFTRVLVGVRRVDGAALDRHELTIGDKLGQHPQVVVPFPFEASEMDAVLVRVMHYNPTYAHGVLDLMAWMGVPITASQVRDPFYADRYPGVPEAIGAALDAQGHAGVRVRFLVSEEDPPGMRKPVEGVVVYHEGGLAMERKLTSCFTRKAWENTVLMVETDAKDAVEA